MKHEIALKCIDLVGYEVFGKEIPEGFVLDGDQITELLSFAEKHDIDHLVSDALLKLGIASGDKLYRKCYAAVRKSEIRNSITQQIIGAFECSKIKFVLLKGASLKNLYPEEWMRTSCDLDILVMPENLQAAENVLKNMNFKITGEGTHDIRLESEDIVVELHFSLIEENRVAGVSDVLNNFWEHCAPAPDGHYQFTPDFEMQYFYHLAHMAKHILKGGIGIRFYIDLHLLNDGRIVVPDECRKLLTAGGLQKFAEKSLILALRWFSDIPAHDYEDYEAFVFSSGIYGTRTNIDALRQSIAGSKAGHLKNRIFMPYSELCETYPNLKNKRLLTPIYEIRRFFRIAVTGRKRAVAEIKRNSRITDQQRKRIKKLIDDLAL